MAKGRLPGLSNSLVFLSPNLAVLARCSHAQCAFFTRECGISHAISEEADGQRAPEYCSMWHQRFTVPVLSPGYGEMIPSPALRHECEYLPARLR